MLKSIIFQFCFFVFAVVSFGQSSLIFNKIEYGAQEHCASTQISFQPGYSYSPIGSNAMNAYISSLCTVNNYAELSKKIRGEFFRAVNDKLYVKYYEEYNTSNLKFNIYDDSNVVLATEQNLTVNTFSGYGNNWMEISLQGAGYNFSSGYYILEVINEKEEKWYLRFKY